MLANRGIEVIAVDLHRPMLREQVSQARAADAPGATLIEADMRALPLANQWFDMAVAGWSIGHLRAWYDADWRSQMERVLSEMERTVRPGGELLILETLGTGQLEPQPPTEKLAQYYDWLEIYRGFERRVLRTDYQFENVEAAVQATEFFFGPSLPERIRRHRWARIPEWTGLWTRRLPGAGASDRIAGES